MNDFFKYTYRLIFCTGFLFMVSCKKNNLVVDKDVVPPAFAKFNTVQNTDTMGTYYVNSANDPYNLPIGVTNVSNVDRTIQFTYTGSATQGTQFTAPASIVIKAGEAIGTLTVTGMFSGYPSSSRKDTVTIAISGGDVPASAYKGKYYLILRKYCDVNQADFYGDYNNVIDNGSYGPYHMTVVDGSGVTTGPTTGTIKVTNLWDYYGGDPFPTLTVNLDWADPANFKVTIPDQKFLTAEDLWVKGTTPGTFSSCDQTFTFRYTLYTKSTGANAFANQETVMER
jgi:hypothetical protein